jgi:hypothetical protein
MSSHQTEQQKINARGRAIGAKIRIASGWCVEVKDGNYHATIASGWRVEAKDGNIYHVTTTSELHALIDNLEKNNEHNNNLPAS